jgi:hypothetical protein
VSEWNCGTTSENVMIFYSFTDYCIAVSQLLFVIYGSKNICLNLIILVICCKKQLVITGGNGANEFYSIDYS